ncbi:programmed cell death protein 2 [Peziza echinospora]|nr:programmed cell death protein 2 [Peziza echinospora]
MGEMLFGGGSGGASGAGGNVNPFSMGGSALGGAGGNPFSIGGSGGGGGAFGGSSGGMFSTTTTTAPTTSSTTPKPPTITPTKSFAETLKQNLPPPPPQPADASSSLFGPPEPWPTPVPHTFPTYHLDAEYEQLDAISPETLLKNTSTGVSHIPSATDLLTNNNDSTTSGGGGGADEWGGYTKSDLDSTFQTFADRVSQNPEQVLRYEHRGTPLLYSKSDPVGALLSKTKGAGVPKCKNCGKDRTFEFQVMPHAIAVLEEGDLDALASLEEEAGMEWGTLIVYSCTCVPRTVDEMGVGYVEEWVGVQYEQRKR